MRRGTGLTRRRSASTRSTEVKLPLRTRNDGTGRHRQGNIGSALRAQYIQRVWRDRFPFLNTQRWTLRRGGYNLLGLGVERLRFRLNVTKGYISIIVRTDETIDGQVAQDLVHALHLRIPSSLAHRSTQRVAHTAGSQTLLALVVEQGISGNIQVIVIERTGRGASPTRTTTGTSTGTAFTGTSTTSRGRRGRQARRASLRSLERLRHNPRHPNIFFGLGGGFFGFSSERLLLGLRILKTAFHSTQRTAEDSSTNSCFPVRLTRIFVRQGLLRLPAVDRRLGDFLRDFENQTLGCAPHDGTSGLEGTSEVCIYKLFFSLLRTLLAHIPHELLHEGELAHGIGKDTQLGNVKRRGSSSAYRRTTNAGGSIRLTLVDSLLLNLRLSAQLVDKILKTKGSNTNSTGVGSNYRQVGRSLGDSGGSSEETGGATGKFLGEIPEGSEVFDLVPVRRITLRRDVLDKLLTSLTLGRVSNSKLGGFRSGP